MITGMPRIAIAVRDFPQAVSTFREKLGMPVVDLSASSVAGLGARLAMCVPEGGSNIEIMSPAEPSAPLSQSLQRFLDRRGEGLFALMLEAPDPDAEAEDLTRRGLNVLPLMEGAAGRDVHPNSTHGVLIRVYPVNSFQRPPDFVAADDTGGPGLSGIVRALIAVRDLDDAVSVYGTKFALDVGEASVDAHRGVRSALCTPPTGGTIELISVVDEERPFARSVKSSLDRNREGLFALVLEAPDLEAVTRVLSARGLPAGASDDSPGVVEIARTATFGACLRIESAGG